MIKRIHFLICMLLASMLSMAATHEYVDLGLPSGTLWATCNVGATAPEGLGSFFAWGETTTKSTYTWANYKYASGTAATATYIGDFLPNNNKVTTIQGTQYDAAKAQWGSDWVMPSKDQVHELIQNSSVTVKTVNGVKGHQYKGPNGNTIFIPCAGFKADGKHTSQGTEGYYWSGTGDVYSLDKSKAAALYIKSGSTTTAKAIQRRTGCPVRAVRASGSGSTTEPGDADPEAVDLGLSVKWATFNVGATSEEKYGNYYAWGETAKKSTYTWANYQHASGSSTTCKSIGADISDTQYDAAQKEWGDDWRMPTAAEIDELRTKCTWTAATVSGVKGYTVKGPSGKTIFLPFAGCSYDGSTNGKGSYAYYWSSEVSEGATGAKAYALYPKSGTSTTKASIQRRTGAVIRPVKGAEVIPPTPEEPDSLELVDLGLSVKWANMNLEAANVQNAGDYYAWGETTKKSTYTWANYQYANGTQATAQNIGSEICCTQYDAAYAKNEEMCLPTAEQWQELVSKCTWTSTTKNGVKGYTVKGPSGKSIFLPLSGCSYEGKNYTDNTYYWTSNNDASTAYKAQAAKLTASAKSVTSIQRRTGAAIRGVECIEPPSPPTPPVSWIGGVPTDGVDLGLSVKWAPFDLYADDEGVDGQYFAWGETEPKSKFTWANYAHCDGSATTVKNIGSNICGKSDYDGAQATWGDDWRLPTESEIEELISKCTFTVSTLNGIKGYTVKGPNNRTIFLPFSGCSYEGNDYGIGSYCYFWSGTLDASSSQKAKVMYIKNGTSTTIASIQRRTGAIIRPVKGAVSTTKEAYAVLSTDKTTLTFYYDNRKTSRLGTKYAMTKSNEQPGWTNSSPRTVVFDSSFADAKPTSCASWFNFSSNSLKTITDIKYLDTSEVTDMSYMFNGCTQLETLDLSTFNTSKVETMRCMFASCSKLMVLNLLWLDASNVRNMSEMFSNCSNLIYLYPPINTSKVTDMHAMFKNCQKLTALQFSSYFDTNHVTNMSELFYNCSMLSELDLTSFNFRSVTSATNMFSGCGIEDLWVNATADFLPENAFQGVGEYHPYENPILHYPPGVSLKTEEAYHSHEAWNDLYKGGYFQIGAPTWDQHDYDAISGTSFIDLGLPSGNLWSEYNVGSIHEWTPGSYLAWSEKDIKKTYTWDNYKKTISTLKTYNFEYCNRERDPEYGTFTDNLDTDADIVNENNKLFYVGIPTQTEFKELIDNCKIDDYLLFTNGWKMLKLTSKNNGKVLYLPYSGCFYDSKTPLDGTTTYYWTSSSVDSNKAYVAMLSDGQVTFAQCQKRTGMPLRAIARYSGTYVNGSHFDHFEVDGIRNVGTSITDDSPVYNLQGVKVEGALKSGVYIKNGRKFVVK